MKSNPHTIPDPDRIELRGETEPRRIGRIPRRLVFWGYASVIIIFLLLLLAFFLLRNSELLAQFGK